jgi:hypothetical protein
VVVNASTTKDFAMHLYVELAYGTKNVARPMYAAEAFSILTKKMKKNIRK